MNFKRKIRFKLCRRKLIVQKFRGNKKRIRSLESCTARWGVMRVGGGELETRTVI